MSEKTIITFKAQCVGAERKQRVKRTRMVDGNPVTDIEDLGYWVLLAGRYQWDYVGEEPPPFASGDMVKVTMEKVE